EEGRHLRHLRLRARAAARRRTGDHPASPRRLSRADRAGARALPQGEHARTRDRRRPADRRRAGHAGGDPLVIALRSTPEIDAIARAGAIIGKLHEALHERIKPGISTQDIDEFGDEFIRSHAGAVPAFKGLYGFPASLCISVNEEVVHGIPSPRRVLQEGDIVTVDAGVQLNGWFADAAYTYPVGQVDEETERLLRVTREALAAGIAAAKPGNRLGDIGHAAQ